MKFFRKPYFTLFLVSLILLVSCNQYDTDNPQRFDDTDLKLVKNQLENFTLISNKISDIDMNHQIMNYLQNQNNVNIEFSNVLYELNDKTTDEKIEITLQTGVLSQEGLALILNLENSFENDNFDIVVSNFEENILSLNLSNEKFESYNNFVMALKLTNSLDPTLFQSNDDTARGGIDCVIATVAFVIAVAALATIEVGSFGTATILVVAGYIAASAAWVRACKPTKNQDE